MAVYFWYLVKIDLSSVDYCIRVHWASHFLQGTRNSWPCLTGHPVQYFDNEVLTSDTCWPNIHEREILVLFRKAMFNLKYHKIWCQKACF